MARRLALVVLCLVTLIPALLRAVAAHPRPAVACRPAGRGTPPRHWIGCDVDAGPRRDLSGQESVLAGVAIDVNIATPEDLAGVPGLSPRIAVEVVADRARNGPYARVDDLLRVRGIGPSRLARSRRFLVTRP